MKTLFKTIYCVCLLSCFPLSHQLAAQTLLQNFYIDFGPNDGTNGNSTASPDPNGIVWNNATVATATGPTLALSNSSGTETAFTLDVTSNLSTNGINHGGLLAPTTDLLGEYAIATATQDYFFTNSSGAISFGNLQPDHGYIFHLFASRDNGEVRISEYQFTGANSSVGTLQSSGPDLGDNGYNGNNRTLYTSEVIFPDADGNIALQISRAAGSFAYVNLLKIQEFSDLGTVAVEAIQVLGDNIIENAATRQMVAEVLPANATFQEVRWSVDDPSVAEITATGLLIPLANGNVTVTATTVEEGSTVSGSKTITISGQQLTHYFLDFGPDDTINGNATTGADENDNHWTNLTDPTITAASVNLVDEDNNTSTYAAIITDAFDAQGLQDGGLSTPEASLLNELAVPTATQDYFFSSNSSTVTFTNLNLNNGYRFRLFGSSAYTGPRQTAYTLRGFNGSGGTVPTSGPDVGGAGNNANTSTVYTSDIIFPDDDGSIELEIRVDLGQFAYLNALRLTEYADFQLCAEVDDRGIVVMGSSVARGQGAPNDMGYAYQYTQLLDERASNELGLAWGVTNISVGGNNTANVLDRWATDLAPLCDRYVIYGLSLGNEGVTNQGQAAFDRFRDNLQILLDKAQARGMVPVVVGNYTRADFDAVEYAFIKQINLLIHEWAVPSVNVLGAIDNGSGNWADGYQADLGHPNLAGHTEFFYAFVPSLFDALAAGKPLPERTAGTYLSFGSSLANEPILFTPEHTVHPFTISVQVRTEGTGQLLAFTTPDGEGSLGIDASGRAVYTSPNGNTLIGSEAINDGAWHELTLTHYYARGRTFLYRDATAVENGLPEELEPGTFRLSGTNAPENLDLRELFFYRSAMNPEEITALHSGAMLKSSLEIYAPLDGQGLLGDNPIVNLAQSTNTLQNDVLNEVRDHLDQEDDRQGYRVFPNPVRQQLHIVPLLGQEVKEMRLLDPQGRRLYTGDFREQLDLTAYTAGIYFLEITKKSGKPLRWKISKIE